MVKPLHHPRTPAWPRAVCGGLASDALGPPISTKDWHLCPDSFNCTIAAIQLSIASNILVQQQTALSDCQCQQSIPELQNRHKVRSASTCSRSSGFVFYRSRWCFQLLEATATDMQATGIADWRSPGSACFTGIRWTYILVVRHSNCRPLKLNEEVT
jgi:hypothetical protein